MTFDDFAKRVRGLCDGTAGDKGYNTTGVDGPNALFDSTFDITGDYGHALGEIVYKARRYAARKNPEDLLKAAAWAFLVLRHADQQVEKRDREVVARLSHETEDVRYRATTTTMGHAG